MVEIQHSHQPDLFYLLTDKRVTRYYHVIPLADVADVRKVVDLFARQFAEKAGIRWGIALQGRQELIGFIGFTGFQPPMMVFALVQEYWGKGLMGEAIKAVADYTFNTLQVDKIQAQVLPGNTASERVLAKSGFLGNGLIKDGMEWAGKSYDINLFTLENYL
ncbi:GNAT family N-acetyltransferase [Chitinophaga sp. 212800010-3]|uniref:GNAT family N-acetyltransferase n=1 Tax=unclassified Chitinophaga TaxID=2619133 RepID=UPI002E162CB9